ncbi:hypothetical protein ACFODL_18180 [Phenylobacterium terrae]|uniref:DUF3617 domain-containing protein n=1 Tax=Phenylobacterium terrae TaxID=2665495 RepID=A0ABW4N4L2_9CAUL
MRGDRITPRPDIAAALSMGAIILSAAAIPALVLTEGLARRQALRGLWTIEGPPCPTLAQPGPDVFGPGGPRTFVFGEAALSRRLGHASCVAKTESGLFTQATYSVCQFTGPAQIAVRTQGRTTWFAPGYGRRATVTIRRGEVSCVLGGWFGTR